MAGGGLDGWDEERAKGQWAKMATSTMNGMYVTRETPAMMRQRIRHVFASVGVEKRRGHYRLTWKNAQARVTNHARPVGRRV